MDDLGTNDKAASPLPALIIGTIGVGLVAAAAIAPATLVAGLYILGGLTCAVAFVEAVDCERAQGACEPCRWAQQQEDESPAIPVPTIAISPQATPESARWRDAIRESQVIETNRGR